MGFYFDLPWAGGPVNLEHVLWNDALGRDDGFLAQVTLHQSQSFDVFPRDLAGAGGFPFNHRFVILPSF